MRTRDRGDKVELFAESHLKKQGLQSVDKNFNSRYGEIDLIMLDKNTLVFVEVRFRANTSFGSGAETVTLRKQSKIIKTAQLYLQANKKMQQRDCRFDVVSVTLAAQEPIIEWHQNAFQASAW
ncbi:YraN family protein [Kangiella sp.]|uniref:YraN family protein n=1 Tax=Kangiella sp. TaxID=1920245 RepID=UPI0019B02552|nr:YraN family protein [Kangiella sp.]MBD3653991.1 YraN family protein [Kangiella sp.]